jgi:hypothetical protein
MSASWSSTGVGRIAVGALGVGAAAGAALAWRLYARSGASAGAAAASRSHLHTVTEGAAARQQRKAFGARGSAAVYRVVLTGGPCAGKTSALARFHEVLGARGYDVYTCPEVPTILMNGGAVFPGTTSGQRLLDFEAALLRMQRQLEDSFYAIASSSGRPSIIFMDRGLLDPAAYIPGGTGGEQWAALLAALQASDSPQPTAAGAPATWSVPALLARYDQVVHLVTAAAGAEQFYTTANNAVRTETPAQARVLDAAVLTAWAAHPHHAVVGNAGAFDAKIALAAECVLGMLARPPAPPPRGACLGAC